MRRGKVKFLGLKIEGQPRSVQSQIATRVWSLHLQEIQAKSNSLFQTRQGWKRPI